MKFKMPRNSIFAVLLRSPWWISAAIAALLSAGGFAALPLEYAAMGVFAAIPFAVIAIMAAWKQLRAPSETRVQAVAQAAAAMSWTDFSRTVQAGFQRDGCEVERLQAPGADFALSGRPRRHRRCPALEGGARRRRALARIAGRTRTPRRARSHLHRPGRSARHALQYARANGVSLMQAPELAKLRDLKT